MALVRMRRAAFALAAGAALLLAGCGSGSIESQLHPTRIVVFGDATSDMGQLGSRYTVNDGVIDTWVQQLAASYGLPIAQSNAGGTAYGWGNARIATKPDAAGDSTTPTVQEQVDAFLAAGTPQAGDLIVLSAGTSDIIAEMANVNAGTETSDQLRTNSALAGAALAAQAQRLVDAGAMHVVIVSPYDMGKTPWAAATGQQINLSNATTAFNNAVELALLDQGQKMLFIDSAFEFNLMVSTPGSFGMSDSTSVICNSVDAGPGIGIGANQVNSRLCTPSTVPPGVDWNQFVWADMVYPAPQAHRTLGSYVYSRVIARW